MVDMLTPGDPRQVGRYRLLGALGTGGMGRVFLAQSPGGRLVAVKLIRAELAQNADFRARFAREVATARTVSGIFTAPVVDADTDSPQPWLVTAYVDGPSLAAAVATYGPLPVGTVLQLAAGLAEGLGAIHAAGVVHRDLKPSNVLLASDGPRIIDFGISRAADATELTRTGALAGSPGFMSPEQAEGSEAGPASDIFSLGAVLAFAATGRDPFGTGTPTALLYRVVHNPPDTSDLPPPLRPLVEQCLAKDPRQRPTTDQILVGLGTAQPTANWLPWPVQPAAVPPPPPAQPAGVAGPQAFGPPAGPPTVTSAGARPAYGPAQPNGYQPGPPQPNGDHPGSMQPNGYQPGPPRPNTYRPGPPQPRPARPGLIWAITAGVLAGAVGVAAVVFFLTRSSAGTGRSTTGQQAQSGTGQQQPALGAGQATHPAAVATTPVQQAPSPTATPTATPAVPTAAPTASPLPLSWTNYQDPSGFSINLPTGWTASPKGQRVRFTGPSPQGFTVVVQWTSNPQPDALTDWQQQAAARAQVDPTYQQIGIWRVNYRGYNAADWEFENLFHGQLTHVLDRGFIVQPGALGYAIELYGPDAQWPQAYASMWNNLMTSFEPAS
jgi:hypothetical protein